VSDTGLGSRRRLLRRFVPVFLAAMLLWFGLGQPVGSRPRYQARWIEVDGIRTRALVTGRGDTTLVFLHGYGESLLSWRGLLDQFTGRYRVLAVDLPGFGMSTTPGFAYDYPSYQQWLARVLAQYTRGPLVMVGHSMGGQLAAGYALDHPERAVAAVLLAPAGAGINPIFSDTTSAVAPAAEWVTSAFSFVVPAHDTTWLREPPPDSAIRTSETSREATRLVIQRFDFAALEHRFSEVRQPVLLIWGRQDPTIPFAIGERIAAVLPCRRFVPLLALHRPHQTLPDTVAAEMRSFLRQGGCRKQEDER
jgi:pimeloyl-ACP methyl ester carboxylesterase